MSPSGQDMFMARMVWIVVVLALLCGCAAGNLETADPLGVDFQDDADKNGVQDPAVVDMFRRIAGTALGTPYVRGGTGMEGFDCSGFVQWTYRNMGIELPRTAREQSKAGWMVHMSDLRTGDIVTFRHPRRGWHSGIYMGDDQFVHSPNRRQRVRYSSMSDPYYRNNFVVARRVMQDGAELVFEDIARRLALAESQMRLIPEEPARKVSKKGKPRVVAKGKKAAKVSASAGGGKKNSPRKG